jgi:hypothetical protein
VAAPAAGQRRQSFQRLVTLSPASGLGATAATIGTRRARQGAGLAAREPRRRSAQAVLSTTALPAESLLAAALELPAAARRRVLRGWGAEGRAAP